VAGFRTVIRSGAYAMGPQVVDLFLRVYDERLYPSRLVGKPDPNPSLTSRTREAIDFGLWCHSQEINPRTIMSLLRLARLSEVANLDIGQVMSCVTSGLWKGETLTASRTHRLLRKRLAAVTGRSKRHRRK
jgi:hypothetical protein